jgi:hypothetical protein
MSTTPDNERTVTRLCAQCSSPFTLLAHEIAWYEARGWLLPRRCSSCRHAARTLRKNQELRPANPPDARRR